MNEEYVDFIGLGQLIVRSEWANAYGTLATVIERDGVWGWDRFDRFRHFDAGSAEAHAALDLLEGRLQREKDAELSLDDDLSGLSDPAEDPLNRFGWQPATLPKFDLEDRSGAAAHPKPPRPGSITKIDNTNFVIIGALLDVIEGKTDLGPHPGWVNRTAFIKWIAQKFSGIPGLSVSTLEPRFRKAIEFLEEA